MWTFLLLQWENSPVDIIMLLVPGFTCTTQNKVFSDKHNCGFLEFSSVMERANPNFTKLLFTMVGKTWQSQDKVSNSNAHLHIPQDINPKTYPGRPCQLELGSLMSWSKPRKQSLPTQDKDRLSKTKRSELTFHKHSSWVYFALLSVCDSWLTWMGYI